MPSVNISITIYTMLKCFTRAGQGISEFIRNLVEKKDIRRCYGILSDRKEELKIIEKEALLARKEKWRGAVV